MSLFGGSSSSTTNLTQVENVGASSGSVAAGGGSSVNILDAGAIKNALDFGGHALDIVKDVNQQAQDSLAKSFDQSAALVSQTIAKQTADSGERVQAIVQYVIWGAVALGAVMLLRGGFR